MQPENSRFTPSDPVSEKLALWTAGLLGILLQIQYTLEIEATAMRLSLADLLLLAAAPILLIFVRGKQALLRRIVGMPLLLGVAFCTAALTLSLIIGRLEFGIWNNWAIVKYAGWYVLLAYAFFGMALAIVGGRNAILAMAACLIATQLIIAVAYLVSVSFELYWSVQYGSRLAGWAVNPNAMAFHALTGFALAIGFNGQIRCRVGTATAIWVPGVLAAMVLLTRSIAGSLALVLLLVCIAALRLVGLRQLMLIITCCATAWVAPQLVNATVSENVFVKTIWILQSDSVTQSEQAEVLKKLSRTSRMQSFELAIKQWRSSPLIGNGLGSHLAVQETEDTSAVPMQIHNTALWLATETGLAGLTAFAALIGFFALRLCRGLSASREEAGWWQPFAASTMLVLAAAVIMSMFHEMLYQRMFWVIAGAALVFTAGGTFQPEKVQEDSSLR